MIEFVFEMFRPANLLFTVFLGLITCYWILVGLGALDFNSDPGMDVGDGDLNSGDASSGHAGEMHSDPATGFQGAFKAMLQFLNFGDVPAMIVVSIMALSLWTFSMLGSHYFSDGSIGRSILLIVPNLLLSAVITKVATAPLKKLFNALNRDYEEHKPVVGRTCTIMTSEVTDKFGQAQIETSGAPLLINVRTYGDALFSKGEAALIIKEDKENNIYTVAKLESTTPQQEISLC
jgi:hypothetical protein